MGRLSVFETKIKPNKEQIIASIKKGASERSIANELNISWSAWSTSKVQHPEIKEWIDVPRASIVNDLKGALIKKALGFTYEEKVQEIKQDIDSSGRPIGKKYIQTKIITHYAEPDTTAIFGCLKIYDKDKLEYDIQAQSIELKKQEMQLKEKIINGNSEEENSKLIEKLKNVKIEFVDRSIKDDKRN